MRKKFNIPYLLTGIIGVAEGPLLRQARARIRAIKLPGCLLDILIMLYFTERARKKRKLEYASNRLRYACGVDNQMEIIREIITR